MLNKTAQTIAVTASDIIGYSVLLTDNDGTVLGASDVSRVGSFHEASLDVIRTGTQAFHDDAAASRLRGTKAGTTLPIIINGDVVGSIGISGRPQDISRYGMLIKMLAEVFLKEQLELESVRLREEARQNLLREIITLDGNSDDAAAIISHGRLLGYDLTQPRLAAMIQVVRSDGLCAPPSSDSLWGQGKFNSSDQSVIRQMFKHRQDLLVSLGDNRYIVFVQLTHAVPAAAVDSIKQRCCDLVAAFKERGTEARIGLGSPALRLEELKTSYHDAVRAMSIAERRPEQGVLYINDFYLEKLALDIPQGVYMRFFNDNLTPLLEQRDGREMISMIRCWCESRFNFSQTARELNIHKNTLSYRFNRFKELTGFDLYDFNSTMAIYLSLLLFELSQEGQD